MSAPKSNREEHDLPWEPHTGKEKARVPTLCFESCSINNNRVCWNCASYVISGEEGLCFLGTSSVNPRGGRCQGKQGSHGAQRGTCTPTATHAQANAFLSPAETKLQVLWADFLNPKTKVKQKVHGFGLFMENLSHQTFQKHQQILHIHI